MRNIAPVVAAELPAWRQLLARHRRELLRDVLEQDGGAAPDERALTLRLIDRALAKIDGGGPLAYGLCERTRQPIARERLELVPWTPLSLEGATELAERFMTVHELLVD